MTKECNSILQLDTALKELKIHTANDLVRMENCLQSLAWKLEFKTEPRSKEEELKLKMLQSMLKVSESYSRWESGQKINRGWNSESTQAMTESSKKNKDLRDTESSNKRYLQ